MKTIDLIQGSAEWLAHRAAHFNASDAPAMMGCSPYMTRTQLLQRMATGISPDADPATQRRFDDGHRFEALARPLAEKFIGEDLYAVTGTHGKLSASFDGLTMLEDTAFEHKTLNESLRYSHWDEGNGAHLPLHYRAQMEHQLIVSGAERVLFMASKWAGEELVEERHCWYVSEPELRTQILAGWEQFEKDSAAYTPAPEAAPAPTGKAPDTLPALHIVIQGGVSASNLEEFKATALNAIQSVNRDLTTDAHFADAEKAVKWCADVEDRIKAAKDHALSQTASIDALFRAMDDISAEARRVRLDLDKLVKARKESIKGEIVAGGAGALRNHIDALNTRLGKPYMPMIPADFGGCIKGLKSVASIQNAVDTELARAKIEANRIADLIQANLATLVELASEHKALFPDTPQLVLKATDDCRAVVVSRIAEHQAAEQARAAAPAEKERERIRAEESAKLQREADAATAKQIAAAPALSFASVLQAASPVITSLGQAAAPAPVVQAMADTGTRIKLGDINARLAPISMTADGLAQLGFAHVATDKSAKLYRESDWPAICAALVARIQKAALPQRLAA